MKPKHLTLLFLSVFISCSGMRGVYDGERASMVKRSQREQVILTDSLIANLPAPIQKHLRVCGYVGSPVPFNCEIIWRESFLKLKPENDWGQLDTEQFNSVNPIGRISFMKFHSMPLKGRDIYLDGYGEMKGKLLDLITVVEGSGPETSQSAMITSFAEFPFIPGYLLQNYIEFHALDSNTVEATLTEGGMTVVGIYHFNDEGFYSKFETSDRFYADPDGSFRKVPYTINIMSYQNQSGIMIPDSLNAVWNLPGGNFEYFKGRLKGLDFNVSE